MDLTVDFVNVRDLTVPNRDGRTSEQFKEASFYIGKFGPFVERLPVETYDTEIVARVAKLKATLGNLPK